MELLEFVVGMVGYIVLVETVDTTGIFNTDAGIIKSLKYRFFYQIMII